MEIYRENLFHGKKGKGKNKGGSLKAHLAGS